MSISFGIEFEFDHIYRDGRISSQHTYIYQSELREGWRSQDDYSAGCEISTPVFTDIVSACSEISEQFLNICDNVLGHGDYAPYFMTDDGRSLGQHVHVGKPNERLSRIEKGRIATHVAKIYPFLASLQANPVPSRRGLSSRYCFPIWSVDWNIPNTDHYCEISESHLGTVEFRLFDANIPQATLTNVYIIQRICERVVNSSNSEELNKERYREDREKGLRHGLNSLDILGYLEQIRDITGNFELPSVQAIREILYLACRYGITPYNLYNMLSLRNTGRFQYFKYNVCNVDKYLENILQINEVSTRVRGKIEGWIEDSKRINDLNELIGIARVTVERLREATSRIQPRVMVIPRSIVATCVEENRLVISRIREVNGVSVEDVANRISELLRLHGDGLANPRDPRDVIESRDRFYVAYVTCNGVTQIVGCIAINMSSGEIKSMVVDRRYRRLGVASRLIQYVLGLGLNQYTAYVKRGNTVMKALLESFGFRVVREDDKVYCMAR